MTTWAPLGTVLHRRIRVSLAGAPSIVSGDMTITPTEAAWLVVPWGQGHKVGSVVVEGDIVGGKGSRSGGKAVLGFACDKQPAWLADIMAEAVDV